MIFPSLNSEKKNNGFLELKISSANIMLNKDAFLSSANATSSDFKNLIAFSAEINSLNKEKPTTKKLKK